MERTAINRRSLSPSRVGGATANKSATKRKQVRYTRLADDIDEDGGDLANQTAAAGPSFSAYRSSADA